MTRSEEVERVEPGPTDPIEDIPESAWQDFNDVPGQAEASDLQPDRIQIAIFVDVVFDYCEGLVPVRGFVDKGQDLEVKPHNIWLEADQQLAESALTFAEWASQEGVACYVIPGTVDAHGKAKAADVRQMQTVLVDLDTGDTGARLDHLIKHLGDTTLIVESGGVTDDGHDKLHVWWRLTEPAEGEDLALVCQLRKEIADKVGGDTHFQSAHQPIRMAGTIHCKHGVRRLVRIRDHNSACEVDLHEFADRVSAMPPLVGIGAEARARSDKPSIDEVLTKPVHEGGRDGWTRFQGASAAIGHFVRVAHDGHMTRDEAWEAICEYNAAMLRPPWPIERLAAEVVRLWRRHETRYGPGLDREAASASSGLPTFSLGALLDDSSPMPDDIIGPRVLTPGDLLVIGGPPKVGKSDFVISLLVHMAAGVAFLGFSPPRPLRIFYLQAEIRYDFLRERMQAIRLDPALLAAARDNLVATPKVRMLLDADGVALTVAAIQAHYADQPPDIICVDPIRNLFDGGPEGGGEADNQAMMHFLQVRVEALREAVAPEAGVILIHHTRKTTKQQLAEDPFQALSGAGSLRSFYTAGIVLVRPDEKRPQRQAFFELRNGPPIETKILLRQDTGWIESALNDQRLAMQGQGARHDAERRRQHDVILQQIFDEAAAGRVYTPTQFAEQLENRGGLGSASTIRGRISVLSTRGFIRYFKNAAYYGLDTPNKSKFGYMCVEGMILGGCKEACDPETGEINAECRVIPTHYKFPQTGEILPVEDPENWTYDDAAEGCAA